MVARPQLLHAGLSPDAVRHRLEIGRLHPLLRGVYAVGRPQVAREGWWMAATLAAGPEAVLSHECAARLYSIRTAPGTGGLHVTVPRGVRRDRAGLIVHSAPLPPQAVRTVLGIPALAPERVLLTLAASGSERQ